MIQPELFDVVELLVPTPEVGLLPGRQGAIVEYHSNHSYEVEFTNNSGDTETLCTLSPDQFVVVWQSQANRWLPISEKVTAVVSSLPEDEQQQVLAFARSLHQSK
jgi:Domain of unknown function (DUF4926)